MAQRTSRPDPPTVVSRLVENAALIKTLYAGPRHKRELADELDVSPHTIYRKARQLDEYDVLERTEEGYRLTSIGKFHAQLYEDLCHHSEQICRVSDLVSTACIDDSLPYWILDDANVVRSDPSGPHRPLQYWENTVRNASRIAGLLTIVFPQYVDTLYERIASSELTGQLVLEPSVLETLETDFSAELSDVLAENAFTLEEASSEIPFDLVIVHEPTPSTMVVLYGPEGGLCGIVHNDSTRAVEWATTTYRTYRDGATPVET